MDSIHNDPSCQCHTMKTFLYILERLRLWIALTIATYRLAFSFGKALPPKCNRSRSGHAFALFILYITGNITPIYEHKKSALTCVRSARISKN